MAVDTSTSLVSRAGRLSDAVARVQSRHVTDTVHADAAGPKLVDVPAPPSPLMSEFPAEPEESEPAKMRFWPGLFLFVLGAVVSATALFTYAWLAAGPAG
jgi:hypothetical protein